MKLPGIFRNFPRNLPEIFTFRNSYEFHSKNFYILRNNFINNYYMMRSKKTYTKLEKSILRYR